MAHKSNPLKTHQPCPSCGSSDAMTVYSDGHTYCFSCQKTTNNKRENKGGTVKVSSTLLTDLEAFDSGLSKRKLSAETLRKFEYKKILLRGNKVYHVAPYYDQKGSLVAQHLRSPEKEFSWRGAMTSVQLFGQRLWASGGRMVIVTEGEFDCMSVSQMQDNKWPVVSIPSGVGSAVQSFKDNLEWLESFDSVVICFDNDEPGRKAAKEVAQILTPGKAKIAQTPLKDASDMLVDGQGKALMSCIWNAAPYRPDGIISGPELLEAVLSEPQIGYPTPYEGLDKKTYGIRMGELWLFTAGSGIGKSTVIHEIGYDLLMRSGLKLGVMALEEPKEKTAKRYPSIYLNKPLYLPDHAVSLGKMTEAFDKTIGQKPARFELYDHFGASETDVLISKIRYMLVALNVDVLILDHISIVVSGLEGDAISEGERRTIDILMSKLKKLTVETGKTILAVVHLKRPEAGKSWNEGKEPRLTDLRGSAALEQLSDVVVALYRDQTNEQKENQSGIVVLKNRPVGYTGKAGMVEYNKETGRLLSIAETGERYGFKAVKNNDDTEEDF